MTYLTIQKLKSLGACRTQLEEFERVFGKRAKITKENLIKAGNNYIYWPWFVQMIGIQMSEEINITVYLARKQRIHNKEVFDKLIKGIQDKL
jgi:hypothetical protein